MEHLLYANHPRNQRNVFFINGFLTFLLSYIKTRSITGLDKLIARTAAFQVNTYFVLLLGPVYWAAAHLGLLTDMDKPSASKYLYEVFVLSGTSMTSKMFADTLGDFNGTHLGVGAKLRDFRQLMSCVLISATGTSHTEPNDDDINVTMAHQSFGHEVTTGRTHYAIESITQATKLAPDVIARMQEVSLKWQVFVKLVHPVVQARLKKEHQASCTFIVDQIFPSTESISDCHDKLTRDEQDYLVPSSPLSKAC